MDDQFYIPVKSKKNKKLQGKQTQPQPQPQGLVASDDGDLTNDKMKDLGNPNNNPKSKLMSFYEFGQLDNSSSNLAKFLEATIPSVPIQQFSKTTMKGWRSYVEYQHYFTLGDLWESFRECSAYGAGVSLVLDGIDDECFQYYVPYLSAIQLYGDSSMSVDGKSRPIGEKSSAGDDSKFSSGEESSDYEFEEDIYYSTSTEEHLSETKDVPSDGDMPSSLDEDCHSQAGYFSDDNQASNYQDKLLFQFFEQQSPYCREPLANKVAGLATSHPQVMTLRSCDLLPFSWMAVAWYPIHKVPSGSAVKDLDACFLTGQVPLAKLTMRETLDTEIIVEENMVVVTTARQVMSAGIIEVNDCNSELLAIDLIESEILISSDYFLSCHLSTKVSWKMEICISVSLEKGCSSLKGETGAPSPKLIRSNEINGTMRFMLPAFGLAYYKFNASIWAKHEGNECPLLSSLKLGADNWLRQLNVSHPDFEFFVSRSSYQR